MMIKEIFKLISTSFVVVSDLKLIRIRLEAKLLLKFLENK